FWLVGGLVPFCIAPHKRADLILPLYVPGALLAGRELARWLRSARPRVQWGVPGAIAAAVLALAFVKYHVLAQRDHSVQDTLAVRELARSIERATGGVEFPLTHVSSVYATQYYLNTMRP